jgi:hypothetical protein
MGYTLTAAQAAKYLETRWGHPVDRNYIRKLVQYGKLSYFALNSRLHLYSEEELSCIVLRPYETKKRKTKWTS